jgi:protein-S-isoprenylcysteine O-methyltransferase Ste14
VTPAGPIARDMGRALQRWLGRTPVQTFLLCPALVVLFELWWRRGTLPVEPWGCVLLAWGYLQYRLVGRYRHPRAGGGWGFESAPDHIVATGPYRYTRNPMYLGHLIFMLGLAIAFRSWFALALLIARERPGFITGSCRTKNASPRGSAMTMPPTAGR